MLSRDPAVLNEAFVRTLRCGRIIATPDDFEQAEVTLTLRTRYELVADHPLKGGRKIWLGKAEPRRCRYCQNSEPDASFSTESHAIPECLGNDVLISADECDACNSRFSESFEHHMDRYTQPLRPIFGIRGKNGVPKYKGKRAGLGEFTFDPRRRSLLIVRDKSCERTDDDPTNKEIERRLPCARLSYLEVYRCLVKMGFSLLPNEELSTFEKTRVWLLIKEAKTLDRQTTYAGAHVATTISSSKSPSVRLWRRKDNSLAAPYMMAGIKLPHLAFAFAMPPHPADHLREGETIMLPAFDLSEDAAYSQSHWEAKNFQSTELSSDCNVMLNTTPGDRVELDADQFRAETGWDEPKAF